VHFVEGGDAQRVVGIVEVQTKHRLAAAREVVLIWSLADS
jgi:hypothetical protein